MERIASYKFSQYENKPLKRVKQKWQRTSKVAEAILALFLKEVPIIPLLKPAFRQLKQFSFQNM